MADALPDADAILSADFTPAAPPALPDADAILAARFDAPPAGPAAGPQLDATAAPESNETVPVWQVNAQASTPLDPKDVNPPSWLSEMVYPTKTVDEGGVINPKYEDLPDWMRAPEVANVFAHPTHSALAILGTLATGADKTKDILEKQFPGLKGGIRQDGQYLLIKSKEDGQTYAWKPGVRPSDFARFGLTVPAAALGTAAATALVPAAVAGAVPAGIAGIVGGAGAAAAGATTLEGLKAAAGGGFSPGNVALQTAVGAGIPLAGKVAGGAKNALMRAAGLAPEGEELAQTMIRAARGGTQAAADVARQIQPDPAIIAAGERQGLTPQIQPDQASANPRFQQLAQAVPGAAERHAATDAAVRQRFAQVVADAGGDVDRSLLEGNVRTAVEKEIADKLAASKQLYGEVDAAVPKNTPAPLNGLLAKIDEIAAERNGRLPPTLQKLRAAASPVNGSPRTWGETDALVKELGNPQGAYKKLEPGLAKTLRPIADLDRQAVAEANGVGDKFRDAQEKFKEALAFENEAMAGYGKDASNALQRIDQGAKTLAAGNVEPFEKVMAATPAALRTKVADSSLLSVFSGDGKTDPVKWFDSLRKNERAYNALMANISPSVREGLHDSVTILRGIQRTAAAKGMSGGAAFTEPRGIGKVLLSITAKHIAGAAGGALVGGAGAALGLPLPVSIGGAIGTAIASDVVLYSMLEPKASIIEAMKEFITSPAGRIALDSAASGTAIPQSKLAAMAASAPVQGLMKVIGIPGSDSFRWLSRAVTTGAAQTVTQPGLKEQN